MSTNFAVVKKLKQNKLSQKIPVTRTPSLPAETQIVDNLEDITSLQKDLKLLEKKLYEVQNQPHQPDSVATFVSTVRNDVEAGKPSMKLHLMEKVVAGIVELDREILKKTAPYVAARPRRNSRGGGQDSDLHLLPTHLTLVDRLMDFHTALKREQPVPVTFTRQQSNDEASPDSTFGSDIDALQRTNSQLVTRVTALQTEVHRLATESKSHKEELKAAAVSADAMVKNMENLTAQQLEESRRIVRDLEDRSNYTMEQIQASECVVVEHILCQSRRIDGIVLGPSGGGTCISNEHSAALNGTMSAAAMAALDTLSASIGRIYDWKNEQMGINAKLSSEVDSIKKHHDAHKRMQDAIDAGEIARLKQKLSDSDERISCLCDALSHSESRVCSLLVDADKSQQKSEDFISRIAHLETQLRLANERIETLRASEQSLTAQVAEVHTAFLDADDRRQELEGMIRILSEENCTAKSVNDGLHTRIADCAPIEMLSKDNLT